MVNVSEGKFLGIVDMFDIVTCMLGVLPELKEGDDPSAVEWAGEHFAKTTMGQVIGTRPTLCLSSSNFLSTSPADVC